VERWRSPTRKLPIAIMSGCSPGRAGKRWPSAARVRSGCCGPPPGPRTKAYSDVLYVDALIGPDTVNTMPPETMNAFRDHGRPQASLQTGVTEAEKNTRRSASGRHLAGRSNGLAGQDGVDKFADAADLLYGAIAEKCAALSGHKVQIAYELAGAAESVDAELKSWTKKGNIRRMWAKDAQLWTGADENKWLGWLDIARREKAGLAALEDFAGRVKHKAWSDVVLARHGRIEPRRGGPARNVRAASHGSALPILDSTDPDEIGVLDKAITLASTLFIVASKSGSTLEPNIFKEYYFDRVANAIGRDRAGERFVAITDPGSSMEKTAAHDGFADVFHGDPMIGGAIPCCRISVWCRPPPWGSISSASSPRPAACRRHAGRSVLRRTIRRAARAYVGRSGGQVRTRQITVVASKGLASFGAWMEQLVAESTGKQGKGLIPVDGEPLGTFGQLRLRQGFRVAAPRRRRKP